MALASMTAGGTRAAARRRRALSAGDLYATPWTYDFWRALATQSRPFTGSYGTIDWRQLEGALVHVPSARRREPRHRLQ